MSPVTRPMSGDVLRFRLEEERAHVNDVALLERHGRNARTLVKEGPLRLTLMMLGPGGRVAPHHADGPIAVHVLNGDIRFRAAGQDHHLAAGELLVVHGGLEHDVASDGGGTFLLTVVHSGAQTALPSEGQPEPVRQQRL